MAWPGGAVARGVLTEEGERERRGEARRRRQRRASGYAARGGLRIRDGRTAWHVRDTLIAATLRRRHGPDPVPPSKRTSACARTKYR